MKNILFLFLFLIPISLKAHSSFFPKNQIEPDNDSKGSHIDKQGVIGGLFSNLKTHYAQEFKQKNIRFEVISSESSINAYATYDENDTPTIKITSGMINTTQLNRDAVQLVLCHELGHFLAGTPKKRRGNSQKLSWSSAEGQADFYATAHCLKKVMNFEQKSYRTQDDHLVPSRVQDEIDLICSNNQCQRIARASYIVAQLYAKLDFYPVPLSLTRKDHFQAYQTVLQYPNPQCRLDTMIAGALCENSLEINFNHPDSILKKCQQHTRPSCWFVNKSKD